jgi:hypothetical protein
MAASSDRMSNALHTASSVLEYIRAMAYPIRILTAEVEGSDGMIVTFSDGTTGAYVAEELLELRPHREPTTEEVPSR